MFLVSGSILYVLFTVVSTWTLKGPSAQWKETQELPQKLDSNNEPLQQVMVVQMHYDCQGRLIRQEASKLNFITGLILIPDEEEMLTNIYRRLYPLPVDPGVEGNEVNRIYEGDRESATQPPSSFKSMPGRVRTAPPSLEKKITRLSGAATTTLPPLEERVTERPHLIVDPDRIIDVPVRSCPSGENEDRNGQCRPEYP